MKGSKCTVISIGNKVVKPVVCVLLNDLLGDFKY